MSKEATLHYFWSSFGWATYEANSVPTGDNAPKFPYITYTVATDSIERTVALTADLWYRGTSWAVVNDLAKRISEAISGGGKIISCDGGCMWINRESPFAQNMSDPNDDLIKRKHINISVEFMTAD